MSTLLVVDDEPAILDLLTTLLKDEGYRVVSAVDGVAALEALGRMGVDLVISDAMMPRLGGLGLIHAMRERQELRDVPVILISAAVTPSLAGLGPCRFLPKPFDLGELLFAVEEVVGQAPSCAER